jgi:hypothetical protein
VNEQNQTADSSRRGTALVRRPVFCLLAAFIALAIGRHLWSRQGELDPRLVGSWRGGSRDPDATSSLIESLTLEPDGSVDDLRLWCVGLPPTYRWSVQGNELWIQTSLPVNPLDGLWEFKLAFGHYRDRLLHSEDLRTRYEIVELTDSTLKLRRLNSCPIGEESSVEEYVLDQQRPSG